MRIPIFQCLKPINDIPFSPSADNVEGFDERSRIERGQLIGPRIFTVGDIIYGAGEAGIHQDIVDFEEARSALLRIKAEGGPASISYKNYNLPSRLAYFVQPPERSLTPPSELLGKDCC